jgi:hypothetical protein
MDAAIGCSQDSVCAEKTVPSQRVKTTHPDATLVQSTCLVEDINYVGATTEYAVIATGAGRSERTFSSAAVQDQ